MQLVVAVEREVLVRQAEEQVGLARVRMRAA